MERASEQGIGGNQLYTVAAPIRDLVLGVVGLILSAPLIAVGGLVARRSTGSTAFFRQVRVGRNGQHFTVYKLRTLSPDAPSNVPKKQAEYAATAVGQFMRRFKLDELPQFWNVVKGEMSLVGPRPIIPSEYPDGSPNLRLAVRPGVTGLWQLSRVRERPFHENPEYDLFYLANRSISFDFWLMWRTLLLIVSLRETKIRLAARIWERNTAWRQLIPERARAIPERQGLLRSTAWFALLLALPFLAVIPAVVLVLSAKNDLLDARSAIFQARDESARLDVDAAEASLDRSSKAFTAAYQKLTSWPTLGLRAIPGASNNIRVPIALARSGSDLVAAGQQGLNVVKDMGLEEGHLNAFRNGSLDLKPFVDSARAALNLERHLAIAQQTIAVTSTSFLIPPVSAARSEALAVLSEARRETDAALALTLLVPRVFGHDRPRTWLLGAENTAELRGRGGYLGSIGTLSTDAGQMRLGDFQPTSQLQPLPSGVTGGETADPEYLRQYFELGGTVAWQNLLMSPDFPSGAPFLISNLKETAGISADGLISMDPVALSYLLKITGPVKVEGIPESLTASNIVDWSMNKLYFLYSKENDQRRESLGKIASAVWTRLLSGENLQPRDIAHALGRAVSGRHLVMYSSDPGEQDLIRRLGLSGEVAATDGDYLLLVAQNMGENKMDYYLTRHIDYTGRLRVDGSLDVDVEITVKDNARPGMTFPDYVGGSRPAIGLEAGQARDFLALFVPQRAMLQRVLKDGSSTSDFENSEEKGKRRFGTYLELSPGDSHRISFRYRLPRAVIDSSYNLVIQNQATVKPDDLSVRIKLPQGWRVGETSGFLPGQDLVWNGRLSSNLVLIGNLQKPSFNMTLHKIMSFLHRPVSASTSTALP
jgi:lipopolysaccharide/colanic/teichoic acid biosynthesis glycosyltransferase